VKKFIHLLTLTKPCLFSLFIYGGEGENGEEASPGHANTINLRYSL